MMELDEHKAREEAVGRREYEPETKYPGPILFLIWSGVATYCFLFWAAAVKLVLTF
jgi:hypothetical protein